MRPAAIVAVAQNGCIGQDNRLLWRVSADLARFKRLTWGHHLILGRKTFESIGRPLPGRTSIVLSRQPLTLCGVVVVHSLDEAFAVAAGDPEPFVCGGGEIYAQALDRCARVYRTVFARDYAGDTFFPALDPQDWVLGEVERHDEHEPPFRFETWDRKS